MLDRFAPFTFFNGEECLGVVLFRAESEHVIAVVAAFPGQAVPDLILHRLNRFLEMHLHFNFQRFVAFRQILPTLGIIKAALHAHGVEIRGNHALGSQKLLVFIAVQGPAGFRRRETFSHNHDAVLHVRRPGHGIVHHDALLAFLVPCVPDGLSREYVRTKGLGGFLVIKAAPLMIVIIVFYAVRTGIGAGTDRGPGRRGHSRQIVAFRNKTAFGHESAEIVQTTLREHGFKTFGNKAVVTDKGGTFRFGGHMYVLLAHEDVETT